MKFVRLSLWLSLCFYVNIAGAGVPAHHSKKADILWDTYGVPHIYAKNTSAMYYAFGWAQMHNHGNLLLRLYGIARGRSAEYWGAEFAAADKKIRLFKVPELGREAYARQGHEMKKYIDAFAAGINDYVAAHPETIKAPFKEILPVTGEDVMAHAVRVFFLEFLAAEDNAALNPILNPGSNAYAVGRSRSASGNAMLLANPHLPWFDFYTFFEAHLQAPGFQAYGASLVGMPVLTIAFNEHLGWTHTVNTIDAADRYAYTLKDNGFLVDSAIVPFKYDTTVVQIRQPDCTVKNDTTILQYAGDEPVLGVKDNKAYTIKIAGLDSAGFFYEWHLMAKAVDRREFEAALQRMQLPLFNVIYADKAGNIGYFFGGNVPVRTSGDWNFWHGTIDGSQSKNSWSQTHRYNDMPKLFNPRTGFIQNANDPPWYCTYPSVLSPSAYPSYMSPVGMGFRPQRAVNMIRNNFSVTFDDLVKYKLNTGVEVADRFLDELLAAAEKYPDPIAQAAAGVLRKWDRTTDGASIGGMLFINWYSKLDDTMFKLSWDPAHPTETPAGLKDSVTAVKLLSIAAMEIHQMFGSLQVPWGEIFRFRGGAYDFPANGGPGNYGIYRTIEFMQDADGRMRALAGDTYVAAVEFGRKIKARVLLSYGNASQPGSRHIGDQLQLLSKKQLRTPWIERRDILQHLEKTERLGH
ncbi:penicillin acylase family protein [Chitinophaga oryzae]|uniref:Penicillin acylase family protein n=1 Tax=Chitinophaga oryzae TaxID=2725414 RepID=A0AAE6ZGJ4_9BACT|nr:penicillin acylase family protein [Chitinophaga oryzae]QJB32306.1 penicillin acylase family protein [Chitinophaga oryzae]